MNIQEVSSELFVLHDNGPAGATGMMKEGLFVTKKDTDRNYIALRVQMKPTNTETKNSDTLHAYELDIHQQLMPHPHVISLLWKFRLITSGVSRIHAVYSIGMPLFKFVDSVDKAKACLQGLLG